jgi:sigma-B regulation protein RsbU (phosphoserine phosphatase)
MGRAGVAFAVTFTAWLVLALSGSMNFLRIVFLVGALLTGAWLMLRVFRWLAEKAVWRLRHRLIVTYLFIAVAPVVLLVAIAMATGYSLLLQVGMNAVTTELEHRETELGSVAQAIATSHSLAMLDPFFTSRYPGLSAVLRENGHETRLPTQAEVPPPVLGFQSTHGIVHRAGNFFLWSYRKFDSGDVTLTVPLSPALLNQLAPEFGTVTVDRDGAAFAGESSPAPASAGALDSPRAWFAQLRAAEWDRPGELARDVRLVLQTRMSAVLGVVFNRQADVAQGFVQTILIVSVLLFLFVEVICWVIGVRMTRTITGAVHHLYIGTQRVTEGNLAHRMPVGGRDQLAEVGSSFNRMTAHLEQLVVVAKDKERLQSEIEIAQEVQGQLYPRIEERSSHLRVAAAFRPARMVSGDYFDYEVACDGRVALAIGDVSGKGISAALLMSSIQSSLRTQLGHDQLQTPSAMVTRLNRHLCASTSLAKYATFCMGLYDEADSTFTYTNAGHIPPILIRGGQAIRLDVNGTVVGAFPEAKYDHSSVRLESGDLLVFLTDGLTEPENEFGEMFGEERILDLLTKNAHRSEQQIVDLMLAAHYQWTCSDELQDDITLLLARRV